MIYCRKFLTLSNQKSRYKSKCIRMTTNLWNAYLGQNEMLHAKRRWYILLRTKIPLIFTSCIKEAIDKIRKVLVVWYDENFNFFSVKKNHEV